MGQAGGLGFGRRLVGGAGSERVGRRFTFVGVVGGVGPLLIANKLEAVSSDLESLTVEVGMQVGVELGEQIRVEMCGQVVHGARAASNENGNAGRGGRHSVTGCREGRAPAWWPLRRRPRPRVLCKR